MDLRQSTASQTIMIGPFLDNTDGDTEEPGFTIANTDIQIWKFGATSLANKNSGGATYASAGMYYTVLNATDTSALGALKVLVHFAGSLYVFENFNVVTAEYYDTKYGTDHFTVDLTAAAITAIWAATTRTLSSFGTLIADTVTAVWAALTASHTVTDSFGEKIGAIGAVQDYVDATWDELLTAATHNVATSAGRRLRDIASNIVLTGTSPDTAGTANTSIRIELDGDASSVDGAYDPAIVVITGGTGVGQSRQIFEYDGTNKYAYINRTWKVIPDNTSVYTIVGHSGDTHVNEGLATGGGNSTITFNALASSVDDTYVGQIVFLFAGTGEDQSRMITGYVGSTKVATLDRVWETNPVNAETIYAVMPVADLTTTNAKLDTIDGIVDAILLDTGTDGVVVATASKTGYALSATGIDGIWDEIIEGTATGRGFLRVLLAALAGKTTNGGTRFRDLADGKDRIIVVTDATKNRTTITLDFS